MPTTGDEADARRRRHRWPSWCRRPGRVGPGDKPLPAGGDRIAGFAARFAALCSPSSGCGMGKVFEGLDDKLAEFIAAQHMFFVATAPLSGDGHVNVSPKGLDTFRVLGPREAAYLDLVGSGVETLAHLRENGRITLMFGAFDGRPASSGCTAGAGRSIRTTPGAA